MSTSTLLGRYAAEVQLLARSPTSSEESFYPAVRHLLEQLLAERDLPFQARAGTSELRDGGGRDRPDLALYDGSGDFLTVATEVKTAAADLLDLSRSQARNDQIGRYLAQTRAVLLTNVRAFGLLTTAPGWTGQGAVPVEHRRLEEVVELWPSAAALAAGQPAAAVAERLADLVEEAVTRFAPIAEPESLARILARQARRAKADLPEQFSYAVRGLLEDFGKALGITFEGDEGEEFFRSTLVQTAFYALFAGWTLWRQGGAAGSFRWEDVGRYLKIPFLGQLFYEFRHPARIKELRLAPHLDVAAETLLRVETKRFFTRFRPPMLSRPVHSGETETSIAAITYFYEPFLEAFDPELRKQLGVWYTPPEIVQYQVRKIDAILREELGCERGFADERVVVLDPCCGTGAYLIEVMRSIAQQLRDEGEEALLGAALRDVFSRRVIGFEILTAPFVVAQLQLYLLLAQLEAEPDDEHRPAVFLTNALTGWDGRDQLKLHFPELQAEYEAAQRIKREARIIVILGNPPYNRWAGLPIDEERDLADTYKGIHRDEKGRQVGTSDLYERWGIRKHLLDDLYLRFFRLAELRIGERAEFGVVSFISNSSYLRGRSHPIMRHSLLKTFDVILVDDLNGDKYRTGKVIPQGLPGAGTADESVFTTRYDPGGIQVGTCITTLIQGVGDAEEQAQVHYRALWGQAEHKRQALLVSLRPDPAGEEALAASPAGPRPYERLEPTVANRFKFVPWESSGGYEDWPSLEELFAVSFQGVNPNRGLQGSVVDTDREVLAGRMRDYFSSMDFERLEAKWPELVKKRSRFQPAKVRAELAQHSPFAESRLRPYLLFPLDQRWIYYETASKFLNEGRARLGANLEGNEFLLTVPEPRRVSESRPLLATGLFDLHVHDRGTVGFPVQYRRSGSVYENEPPIANLLPGVARRLGAAWGLPEEDEGAGAILMTRRLFRLALAMGHAPDYERDHGESLGQDWAHLPIPRDRGAFERVAELGERVAVLLNPMADADPLLRDLLGENRAALGELRRVGGGRVREEDLVVTYSYFGAARGRWEARMPSEEEEPWPQEWGTATGDLYLNPMVFLRNVPERVWRHELGGYPVLRKWLGYRDARRRDGNPLTLQEVRFLRGMVQRLAALLRLRPRLDAAYEAAVADALTAEELGLRTDRLGGAGAAVLE